VFRYRVRRCRVCHVGNKRLYTLTGFGPQLLGEPDQPFFPTGNEQEIRARLSKSARDRRADVPARSRDYRDLAVETERTRSRHRR